MPQRANRRSTRRWPNRLRVALKFDARRRQCRELFRKKRSPHRLSELPDALADYRFGRIDWRTGTGGRGTSVADDVADFAEIELQLDGQSGRFARLETDLARQPQHRGIFVKDERAQRIEIMPCRARQRRAQQQLLEKEHMLNSQIQTEQNKVDELESGLSEIEHRLDAELNKFLNPNPK